MKDAPVPPPPRPIAAWAFHSYVRSLVGRHFAAVHWNQPVLEGEAGQRVVFVANHTNWWDGFLGYLAGARLGLHFHILMEAENLERYRMFKLIGALPMHRGSAAAAYRDLDRATRQLRRPRTGVWIFPQGGRRPPQEPFRGVERGAAQIALRLKQAVRVWPVAIRYAYLGEQVPDAFVWFGTPIVVQGVGESRESRRGLTGRIEAGMTDALSALDLLVREERLDGFAPLLRGRLSINKRLDQVRHRLGLLRGGFEDRNG
jgi:1-acyl-sn-glycerol-3-phosphate acyltransferase